MSEWLSVIIGLMGLGSILLAALRWRRDDTASLVTTQSTVVHDIQALNDQLRAELAACQERARTGR